MLFTALIRGLKSDTCDRDKAKVHRLVLCLTVLEGQIMWGLSSYWDVFAEQKWTEPEKDRPWRGADHGVLHQIFTAPL